MKHALLINVCYNAHNNHVLLGTNTKKLPSFCLINASCKASMKKKKIMKVFLSNSKHIAGRFLTFIAKLPALLGISSSDRQTTL